MLIIQDKHNCCGCGACEQICPRHCIIMKEDNEGFLYPVINQKDCINCGLCEKVCQYINPFESKIEPLSTYAFVSGDTEKRDKSSSGGLFSQLADSILSNGGYVVGASFDANWNVALSCIEKTEQLDSLRRSKYVKASVGNIFIEVKKLLEEGKTVLFCSTPCQVNGLNHFLRSKEYPNLICVDFTCHAVPSPRIWRDYLCSVSRGRKVDYITFRNKKLNGWNNYSLEIKSQGNILVAEGNKQNLYMRGFLQNLYNRPSCENCASRCFKTGSDLMIGDFWNVEKYHKEDIFNDNRGVSLAMALTLKGEQLLQRISESNILIKVPYSEAETTRAHSCIIQSFSPHPQRGIFFNLYNENCVKLLIRCCLVIKNIKVYFWKLLKKKSR